MTDNKKASKKAPPKAADQAKPQTSNNEAAANPTSQNKDGGKTESPKNLTVTEIIAAMNAKTKQMNSLREEIEKLESELSEMKTEKAELEAKIKPVRRMVKKYNPNGAVVISLSPIEKKANRVSVKVLKNQIILKEDMILKKKSAYAAYHEATIDQMKTDELRNKAQSKHWTKRNKWSVSKRLVKALNVIRTKDLRALQELAKISKSMRMDNSTDFSDKLSALLYEHDDDTAILCSHELRAPLHEAVKATLKAWNAKKALEFKKLVIKDEE